MMNPRLVSSKKWTGFPAEYVSQIKQAFAEAFAQELRTGKLVIEGRIYSEEILLRVGYLENGRLLQANIEVSMNYQAQKQDAIDRIHNCIDAAASMLGEYFATISKDETLDFPTQWKEYDFNGQIIFVQYSTVNTELEAEANRLLGLGEDGLMQETAESADALERATEVLERDEDLDTSQPTIFSKKRKKSDSIH